MSILRVRASCLRGRQTAHANHWCASARRCCRQPGTKRSKPVTFTIEGSFETIVSMRSHPPYCLFVRCTTDREPARRSTSDRFFPSIESRCDRLLGHRWIRRRCSRDWQLWLERPAFARYCHTPSPLRSRAFSQRSGSGLDDGRCSAGRSAEASLRSSARPPGAGVPHAARRAGAALRSSSFRAPSLPLGLSIGRGRSKTTIPSRPLPSHCSVERLKRDRGPGGFGGLGFAAPLPRRPLQPRCAAR